MRLIDTHCHLNYDAYDADRAEVIARAEAADVWRIVVPGTDVPGSREAVALAAAHDGVFAAVGIHPNSSAGFTEDWIEAIAPLVHSGKVVAIGEIGLDYYRDHATKADQHRALEACLALAAAMQLPVIIHNRDASDDLLDALARWRPKLPDPPGVLHSFSERWEVAQRGLDLDFYIGFTGPLTFKNADDLRTVAARVPLDRILIETDGPFLAPHPHRGKRNEPAYVRLVADRLAALHLTTLEAVAEQTTLNACALFC
ncbi:MAG: TatD family hydrolase [Anaerolineae bacterium]|nr:TatD family hydrolase [Anaerolineae bacterium]